MSIQLGVRDHNDCHIPEAVLRFSPEGTLVDIQEVDQYGRDIQIPQVTSLLKELLCAEGLVGRFEAFHCDDHVFHHSAFGLRIQ